MTAWFEWVVQAASALLDSHVLSIEPGSRRAHWLAKKCPTAETLPSHEFGRIPKWL